MDENSCQTSIPLPILLDCTDNQSYHSLSPSSQIQAQDNNTDTSENSVKQTDIDNFEHIPLFTNQGIHIFHLNIHYLYPKFDEIKMLVHNHSEIDIMCLGETFLNENFSDNEFQLNNYNLFRRDRSTNGGGIVCYVKCKYHCTQRHDLERDNIEAIWLEVRHSKQKPFILGYIYRPPSSNSSWINEMDQLLETLYSENKEIILTGDFNYNFSDSKTSNSLWNNVIDSFNLKQLVEIPTRVTTNTSTIIDHVYTNVPCNIFNVQVPQISLSDHYPICFTRKLCSNSSSGPIHNVIKYRNVQGFNENHFNTCLKKQPWSNIEICEDVDESLDCFISMFSKVLNSQAPIKQKRVKHKNLPDWYSPEIGNASRQRDKAKSANNIDQFKYWRNKTKTLISEAKKSFYSTTINQNKQDPKKLWKNLKDLSGKSKMNKLNLITDELGNLVEDPEITAEKFNFN